MTRNARKQFLPICGVFKMVKFENSTRILLTTLVQLKQVGLDRAKKRHVRCFILQ